ncbi:PC-esterase domain-containing protein 1A-like isoform X1 [Astyanax mexicanus]|uniref:PC-esterase domain-containing protein 1A-like n=2 Tax=Astyanax mexicanus TaxID=7994 RepID=A0A8B9HRN1_ASTMX|nr:PC-esterase domain-containing protein 1A-like isoform X1 [Astyanax mexicanus]
MMRNVTHHQASQLLHNKFVVVLGDSIQRSVYKDLVLLLQRDSHLSLSQLKSKGELSFEQDCLVEGGRLGHMNNGTEYREVRQYRSDHHLVRFYFVTRVFSRYMESIFADFKNDQKPDVVIVNSCVWDVSRYNRRWVSEYKENLHKFFSQLKAVLPEQCLIVWNMTMPLGERIIGGFLVPEIEDMGPTLRFDVIEANFYSAMLANAYGLDVLDLHFMFRFSLHCRMKDGVHWNAVAHRQITCLLLAHAAQAWGVELPSHTATDQSKMWLLDYTQTSYQSAYRPSYSYGGSGYFRGPCDGRVYSNFYMEPSALSQTGAVWPQKQQYDGYGPHFCEDGLETLTQFGVGYCSFENLEKNSTAQTTGHSSLPPSDYRPVSAAPSCPANSYVMKQKHEKRNYNPYTRQRPSRSHR